MGFSLGLLMANSIVCSIEENFESDNKMPEFYKRYVDDTLAMVLDIPLATVFLSRHYMIATL